MDGRPADGAGGNTAAEMDPAALAALLERLQAIPRADPLCLFCVVLNAEPWPEYADEKLCAVHLPVARALQCKGWNQDRWHQHLAALARWGKLPNSPDWWPCQDTSCPADG
jgi:hypothetical protein